jgi:hypothetical protein
MKTCKCLLELSQPGVCRSCEFKEIKPKREVMYENIYNTLYKLRSEQLIESINKRYE